MRNLTTIKDMSRLYDIRDILNLPARKKTIVCPLPQHQHHNHTASFSIFTTPNGRQKWVCHGNCQQSGDSIDLIGFMKVPGYNKKNGDHVKEALAILSGGVKINPPRPETTKAPSLKNNLYRSYLPVGKEVIVYAQSRGLTPETLDRFAVGQHQTPSAMWMTIPTIQEDRLMGIKMRNLNAEDRRRRFTQIPGSIDGLFNYNAVRDAREPVLIVKAEITTMLLAQYGFTACAPTGGEGAYFTHEKLAKVLAFSPKRIVVGDNDSDPKVREKIMQVTARRAEIFRAEIKLPPEHMKDLDDWILAEPNIALPTIRNWLSF